MVTCTNITVEKIRATISISGYEIKPPYIKSFNVSKSRTQLASTFSTTFEVPASASFSAGSDIIIWGGVKDNEIRIFTGIIRDITVNPTFDKPGYYMINANGADALINLENRRFSRRIGGYGFSKFVSITGGPTNRSTMGFSTDKRVTGGSHSYTSSSPRPSGDGRNSQVTKMPERGSKKAGERSKIDPIGSEGTTQDTGTGAGIHDHSSMSKGGPAFGVFSAE